MLSAKDSSGFLQVTAQPMKKELASLISSLTYCSASRATSLVESLTDGVIDNAGIVNCLSRVSRDKLVACGLSDYEAVRYLAANRYSELMSQGDKPVTLSSPQIAAEVLMKEIGGKDLEHMAIAVLNVMNEVLAIKVIAVGTATEVLASPRSIFKAVLDLGGTRFLLAHNHPSGSSKASVDDLKLTEQVLQCCAVMDIAMIDHLVVTKKEWYSIRQETGLMGWT